MGLKNVYFDTWSEYVNFVANQSAFIVKKEAEMKLEREREMQAQ